MDGTISVPMLAVLIRLSELREKGGTKVGRRWIREFKGSGEREG